MNEMVMVLAKFSAKIFSKSVFQKNDMTEYIYDM